MKKRDKKAQTKSHKYIGIGLLSILCFTFLVLATPTFTEISTPTGTTQNSSIEIEYNITEANLKEVKFHWSGTNTTIFDDSVKLYFNFDNRSSLGENDTHVVDISGNGNNGTVITGENVDLNTNGRYNNAFNLTNASEIDVPSIPYFNITNKVSFSYWIKLDKYKTNLWGVISGRGNAYRTVGNIIETNGKLTFNVLNSTYVSGDDTAYRHFVQTTNAIPLGEWIHIVSTYSNETGKLNLYYNGQLIKTKSGLVGMGIYDAGGNFNIGSSGSAYAVMNIDDYIYYNKELSPQDVSKIYESQLTKYDSDSYSFYSNQSLNLNTTGVSYEYYLCSKDTIDNENCTASKTITRVPTQETIIGNFSNSIFNINNNFYGAVGSLSLINSNKTQEDWYRDRWNDAKLTYNRRDMAFNSLPQYKGITNWDFEEWYNITKTFNESQSEDECFTALGGWGCTAYLMNSTTNTTISRSTNSYSGLYSLKSQGNGNLSMAHGISGRIYLSEGTYNLSVWINSTGTIGFSVRDQDDLTYPCSKVSSGSGDWEQVNCSFITIKNNTERRIVIEDFGTSEFLVDNFQLLKDGSPVYWGVGNLSSQKSLNNWTYENRDSNQKLLWIANYMAYFNANVSSICGDATDGRSNYSRCPPLNMTHHTDMVINFLNETSNNQEWISVIEVENWNEPYGSGFFLPNGDIDDRIYWHSQIYNATKIALNNYNPNIPFYGMSGYFGTTDRDKFIEYFVANFSDEDGYTLHTYGQDQDPNNIASVFEDDMNKLLGYCSTYGANCSRILWTEWGTWNHSLKNTTEFDNTYKKLIADAIQFQVNNYGNITTLLPYQFAENPTSEPRWGMVYYDNFISSMYNTTKNFATYCPAGSEVYTSTTTDSTLKTVTCKDGNNHNVIVINTDTEARNITVSDLPAQVTNLVDQETSESFSVSSNSADIGVLDSYGIFYLSSETAPTITIQNPEQDETQNPVFFKVTTDELASCILNLDGTNYTMTSTNNLTHTYSKSLTDYGEKTVTYFCTDDSGNQGSEAFTFTYTPTGTSSGPTTTQQEDSSDVILLNGEVEEITDTEAVISGEIYSRINLSSLMIDEKYCTSDEKIIFKPLDEKGNLVIIDKAILLIDGNEIDTKPYLDTNEDIYYFITNLEQESNITIEVTQGAKTISETKKLKPINCEGITGKVTSKLEGIIAFIMDNKLAFIIGLFAIISLAFITIALKK